MIAKLPSRPVAAVILLAIAFISRTAAADVVVVTGDQIARLGVVLGQPEAVEDVEIAAAPAEVAIPPTQEAVVSTPVAGLVSRLFVATSEPISAGQPLAEIQSPEFIRLQREFLDAEAAAGLARAQLERDKGLYSEGIIAERRLQETTAVARATLLERAQALQQLRIAGLDDRGIESLRQRLELEPALVIRAPIDGVVLTQHVKVGASVDALEPIFHVADLSRLWLEIHVPQELAEKIDERVRINAVVGQRAISGRVVNVGSTVDAQTQTVVVRAEIDAAPASLRAGQFLTAKIVAGMHTQSVLAIPAGAVTRTDNATLVFARSASGFDVLPIDLLAEDGTRLYVGNGLEPTTQLAVGGVSALKSLWLSQQEGAE